MPPPKAMRSEERSAPALASSIGEAFDFGEAFVALACGEEEDGGLGGIGEGGEEFLAPESPGVGRSEHVDISGRMDFVRDLRKQIAADDDGVIGGIGFDGDGAHVRVQGTGCRVQKAAMKAHSVRFVEVKAGARALSRVSILSSEAPGFVADGQLVLCEGSDGLEDRFGLREDGVFDDGLVGDEGVHGADAADGGVEGVEEFFADAGGDFRAVAPADHVFMRDEDFAGFRDGGRDGFPVVGVEGAEVEDFGLDA